jgi:hypothetical protein
MNSSLTRQDRLADVTNTTNYLRILQKGKIPSINQAAIEFQDYSYLCEVCGSVDS